MRYTKDSAIYSEQQVRNSLPNVSLPEILLPEHVAEFGFSEYVEPPPPPETSEQTIARLTWAVQQHLDTTARTRNYDGILSACSYAASTHPKFGPEGLACVAWRDAVWAACYSIMTDVQVGNRGVPTTTELIAELPALVWPV